MNQTANKTLKIAFLFIVILLAMLIFLAAVFKIIIEERHMPRLIISEKNRALRGSIVSGDGYEVSYSKKLFKVDVDTRCIDPNKKELFLRLVSIYSGISYPKLRHSIGSKKGYMTLTYRLDAKRAYQLRLLSRKLYQLGVFIPYKVGKRTITQGLTVLESGEKRVYPYKDALTPVIGYVYKYEQNDYTRIKGVKGLERFYEKKIAPKRDGLIKGKRDIGNNIILNKEAIIKKRIDGFDLHLHIPLLLQKNVENILSIHKRDLAAKEIIAAVMDAQTGNILALASSNRYNPDHITKKDYSALNAKVIEYEFEPGSVMKPITFSLLLEHRLVNPYELVRGYNGHFKLGRKVITDEHRFDWLSAENVIVYSSNIGMAQLAQRLSKIQFYKGLLKFGFSRPTGIDLPYEHRGMIIPLQKFRSKIYKATVGYGYGIRVTFMQLLRAYDAFNNGGLLPIPRIGSYLEGARGEKIAISRPRAKRAISAKTAALMHAILRKVVQKGTGTVAKIDGLDVGGKTGTAHMVRHGSYVGLYNSSFFGFANDTSHRYTIGVTVIEPKRHYFASQTAVPVFRDIVLELISEGLLKPQQ